LFFQEGYYSGAEMAEEVIGTLSIVAMITVAALLGFLIGVSAAAFVSQSAGISMPSPVAISGNAVIDGNNVYIFIHSSYPGSINSVIRFVCPGNSWTSQQITINNGVNIYVFSRPWWFTSSVECRAIVDLSQGSISLPVS
jgi:hypothetical protein